MLNIRYVEDDETMVPWTHYRFNDRPVLLAMNNPQSILPEHALYPHPEGVAGHRLYEMLRDSAAEQGLPVSRVNYLERFDRRNLLNALQWNTAEAYRRAGVVLEAVRGRNVIVLGVRTLRALRLSRPGGSSTWGRWRRVDRLDLNYCLLPHPSGRCREYNDPDMRRKTGDLLLKLYRYNPQQVILEE